MKNAKRIIEIIYQLDAGFNPVDVEWIIQTSLLTVGGTLTDEAEIEDVLKRFKELEEHNPNLTVQEDMVGDIIAKYEELKPFTVDIDKYDFNNLIEALEEAKTKAQKAIIEAKAKQAEHLQAVVEGLDDQREFLAVWGSWEKAPTSYEDKIETHNVHFFTVGQGYTEDDSTIVQTLKIGETLRVEEGNHTITRIK